MIRNNMKKTVSVLLVFLLLFSIGVPGSLFSESAQAKVVRRTEVTLSAPEERTVHKDSGSVAETDKADREDMDGDGDEEYEPESSVDEAVGNTEKTWNEDGSERDGGSRREGGSEDDRASRRADGIEEIGRSGGEDGAAGIGEIRGSEKAVYDGGSADDDGSAEEDRSAEAAKRTAEDESEEPGEEDEISEDRPILSEQDPIADVTKADVQKSETDALTEAYIRENLNENYAVCEKMKLIGAIHIKQTFFDRNAMAPGDRPIEIMHDMESDDPAVSDAAMYKFLTQMTGFAGVYDVDEDSPYCVSFINTLQNEESTAVDEVLFAYWHDYAEMIDGCIYDRETGIAYLPKAAFAALRENEMLQAQLLQVTSGYGEAERDVNTISGGEPAGGSGKDGDGVQATTSRLFETETLVQAGTGMDPEKMEVSVNGVVLKADSYDYDRESGALSIGISPALCQTVSVREKSNALGDVLRAMTGTVTAHATKWNDMGFYSNTRLADRRNRRGGGEKYRTREGIFYRYRKDEVSIDQCCGSQKNTAL